MDTYDITLTTFLISMLYLISSTVVYEYLKQGLNITSDNADYGHVFVVLCPGLNTIIMIVLALYKLVPCVIKKTKLFFINLPSNMFK